jgi:catechol 2,3-dioxygenase-like lactoylglutathione lyase family enzyme
MKAKDLQQTLEFYEGALGMQKLFQFKKRGEVIGFYLKAANETFIELFRMDDAEKGSGREILHHFCLETDAIESVRGKLIEKGYAPTEIIMGADKSLQFWVKDPNGLNIEFQQYTGLSSQFTGADVEVV